MATLSQQDVEDAVLERGIETSEDELAVGRLAVDRYGKADAAVAGLMFAQYPFDRKQPSPGPVRRTVVDKIVRRTLQLYKATDKAYATAVARVLTDVAVDEHRFQFQIFRSKIIKPMRDAGVLEAGREDPFARWARATGVYRPLPKSAARELVAAPAPWDGLPWMDRFQYLERDTRAAAEKAVRTSLTAGDDMRRATRRLQAALGRHRGRAELIARTEVQRVSNQMARTFLDANRKHLLGIQCLATLDDLVCMACAPYDRAVFYFPPGQPGIGLRPIYPLHPRCRCRYVPISKLWQKLGMARPPTSERPSLAGPTKIYDLDSWLRHMVDRGRPEIARRVLGRAFAQWAAGKALHRFAGLGPVDPSQVLQRTRKSARRRQTGRKDGQPRQGAD